MGAAWSRVFGEAGEKKQRGGGRAVRAVRARPVRTSRRPSRAKDGRLRRAFEAAGFRTAFLNARTLGRAEDAAFDDYRTTDALKALWHSWRVALRGDDVDALLRSAGWTRAAARRLAGPLQLLWDAYSPSQLVDLAIESATGAGPRPLRPRGYQGHLFPAPDDAVDTWFSSNGYHPPLLFANMTSPDAAPALIRALPPGAKGMTGLLFHTTNWRAAQAMCTDRPRHNKGRQCLDFGMLQSFYAGPDLSVALEWAGKCGTHWGNERAVLIFASPDVRRKLRWCVFKSPDRDWERLTLSSRMCVDEVNELDDCDFVWGPMVANVHAAARGDRPVAHRPPRMQLASKSDAADVEMRAALLGVMWLPKA